MKHFRKYLPIITIICIFLVFLILRTYQCIERAPLGWDQVDNAWAAYRILIDHNFPLTGMMAKLNSGISIGPLYYYFVALFYFFTGMDPIASPIIAIVSSIFNFFILYFIGKKLFGYKTAIAAIIIDTVSYACLSSDRVQWPVNFIATFGLITFFLLYRILQKDIRYIPIFAIMVGLSFHIHFTSIFYPIIVLCTLPLWPITKKTVLYCLVSLPLFFLTISPIIFSLIKSSGNQIGKMGSYGSTYYHGFHLRRMMQLSHDAFIQIESLLFFRFFRPFVFFVLPISILIHTLKEKRIDYRLYYLFGLWILVPWLVFTTYSGELSDYYFFINRYVILIAIAYIIAWLFDKHIILRCCVIILLSLYAFYGIQKFFLDPPKNFLVKTEQLVKEKIARGDRIQYVEGQLESYLYAISRKKIKGPVFPE